MENQAWQDRKEKEDLKEKWVPKVPEVYQDPMEILESVDLEVFEDLLDHRDQLESLEHQVEEECLGLMDLLDLKVNLGIEVSWVQQDLKVSMVTWEDLDHLDCRA